MNSIVGHPHRRRGAAKRCGEGCRRSKPAIRDVKTFPCWHICWQTSVASPSAKRASPRRALHWAARIKALDLCHAGWASECIEHCTVHTTLRAEQEHGECKQRTDSETSTFRDLSGSWRRRSAWHDSGSWSSYSSNGDRDIPPILRESFGTKGPEDQDQEESQYSS